MAIQYFLIYSLVATAALGQFIPAPEERVPFLLQKYRLDECIGIAENFYISLAGNQGTSVYRWVSRSYANDVTIQVGCPACGPNGGNVLLRVYESSEKNRFLEKTGNVKDGLAIKFIDVPADDAVFIQLVNQGTTLNGINIYVITDTRQLEKGISATRSRDSETVRYDFTRSFQLPESLRTPPGSAIIVRFDGDRPLGENYIRFGQPVEFDIPGGLLHTDKFDIWAQEYKTFGDELLLCPPKFNKPYFVSGKSYWDNAIVNYDISYGIIHPVEKLM